MFDWIQGRLRRKPTSVDPRFSVDAVPLYPNRSDGGFFTGVHASQYLYKFGFIACIKGTAEPNISQLKSISGWDTSHWDDWVVAHDPKVGKVSSSVSGSQLMLIGEVFDPFLKEFDAQQIADDLCALAADESAFLERLDNLSGRFLILVKHGREWFVYHDAFGARSIYYNAQMPGVIASHSCLLGEVTAEPVDFNTMYFMFSDAYRKRDVKYLPGLRTIYENIFYCPANHRLNVFQGRTERYWPRPESHEYIAPSKLFIQYLDGYGDYIKSAFDHELFGLTGGLDSRTLFAALAAKGMSMTPFTMYRGDQNGGNSKDIALARDIASSQGLEHVTVKIKFDQMKEQYFSESFQAIRQNTGFSRLNSPFSHTQLLDAFSQMFPGKRLSYSRGFGGEILRGFYQGRAGEISAARTEDFSRAYGVLQGSPFVRAAFQHFIDSSDFSEVQGVDLNDLFYWEHRMSGWGSQSIAETDAMATTFAGYNSRRLYKAFLRMPIEERFQRQAFKDAIRHFRPELLNFPVE
ncbi:hypothetical protein PVT68_16730 [Microbulbifer bruguierae]|uniref:Glutamine amidotransferase type-2 domain-containing protein n=1 Tax=Microbulbifer bruguierae TaxID=3029061 RepID=A0ABY8NF80_9GAMM|nr:hypothetical protein [Microbulbifer bruguierae]WGL16397.1 hypothetical protein PVT68_16730 [Microbulbifer bruguierae]